VIYYIYRTTVVSIVLLHSSVKIASCCVSLWLCCVIEPYEFISSYSLYVISVWRSYKVPCPEINITWQLWS
jgi:hypothetical protein